MAIKDIGPKLDMAEVDAASAAGEGPKLMLWSRVIDRLKYLESEMRQQERIKSVVAET